eukprot:SM000117S25536  [mRNA]  locus=s117:306081:317487:- [translate_table: standard]
MAAVRELTGEAVGVAAAARVLVLGRAAVAEALRRPQDGDGGRAAAAEGPLLASERKQAARRALAAYEALAAEGFSPASIEAALRSLLPRSISLEAALDWLCLHLAADELPIKFSAGVTAGSVEGEAVHVIVAAQQLQPDEKPPAIATSGKEREMAELRQAAKQQQQRVATEMEKEAGRSCTQQADWIRHYMEQQEEGSDEDSSSDDHSDDGKAALASEEDSWEVWADARERGRRKEARSTNPQVRASIASQLAAARDAAQRAKASGDRSRQASAGRVIRELKEEAARLGLSLVALESAEQAFLPASAAPAAPERGAASLSTDGGPPSLSKPDGEGENEGVVQSQPASGGAVVADERGPGVGHPASRTASENEEEEEEDDGVMGGFFDEEASGEPLPPSVAQLQRREERVAAWGYDQDSRVATGAKSGSHKGWPPAPEEAARLPKAVLQQHCQKAGWPAPRFIKLPAAESPWGCQYRYSVMVVRGPTAAGGSSRKSKWNVTSPSGQVTFQLEASEDGFESIAEAQDAVSALALFRLLPEQPLYRIFPPPFRAMWLRWHDEGVASSQEDAQAEEARRSSFVDSLLTENLAHPQHLRENAQGQSPAKTANIDQHNDWHPPEVLVGNDTPDALQRRQSKARCAAEEGRRLLQAWRATCASRAYQEAAEARAKLPMAEKREELLDALRKDNVVVISAETGSGKTTQVPQYILDEMIATGQGGLCNIICTQPRRIAAVSVAERVAAERCEGPPGARDSLVGYQVRLDAARSANTRLLFCTTGILLRRLAVKTRPPALLALQSDGLLAGVSHVVVDEVHERTIQGDFLLVILRQLVARRLAEGLPMLKLVLMSATLDADLYSAYFAGCPVIQGKGRTHPVEMIFLEDIYEMLEYKLASDSPAALKAATGRQIKVGFGDEAALADEVVNPFYQQELYHSFSKSTRHNLMSLNEDVIDFELVEDLVAHIHQNEEDGAILIFLPATPWVYANQGLAEIQGLHERLSGSRLFGAGGAEHWLIPLHSSISPQDQRRAFHRPPPGIRKAGPLSLNPYSDRIWWMLMRLCMLSNARSHPPAVDRCFLDMSVADSSGLCGLQSAQIVCKQYATVVVIATNIAETSITIDDVVYVVDAGKLRENRFDPRRSMSSLVEAWISQANARQRAGRAGRVRPGKCFALYTRYRMTSVMRRFQVPEMLRVPLVELCLQIKLLALGDVTSFLQQAIEPPKPEAITSAVEALKEVGALDERKQLTSLGRHLAGLPVDVRIGKASTIAYLDACPLIQFHPNFMMLYGAVLQCISPVLTVAACLSYKTPFVSPLDQKEAADRARQVLVAPVDREAVVRNLAMIARGQQSDHLAMAACYHHWADLLQKAGPRAAREYCRSSFLSYQTLEMLRDLRRQFANLLADIGFLKVPQQASSRSADWADDLSKPWNTHAASPSIIKAVLVAGLHPNVTAMSDEGGRPRWSDGQVEVSIHPSSVNHRAAEFQRPFLVFHEKIRTTRVYIRDCTCVSPYPLLLFGGPVSVNYLAGEVVVDSWLQLRAPAQTGVLFKELRKCLDSLFSRHVDQPQAMDAGEADGQLIRIIAKLLLEEDKGH